MPIRRATPVAAAVAALAAASATHADGTIRYTVRLDAPQTQMVDIGVEVRVGAEAGFVDFSMPAWRPGRYLIHDPAGGVQEVRATDEGGNALPVEKLDKDTWRVMRGDATAVRLDYRLYANSLGSRTRHVDDTHAFLSGDSVFVYAEGRRDSPVLVEVEAPDAWRIAGGLEFAEGRTDAVVAPDYDVLIDTPLEIGIHDTLEFTVGGRRHEIVIWPVDHAAYDAEQLTGDFARIVEAQLAIFGRLPYERYVFLVHAGAGAGGGTEHLNSTIMQTSRAALEGGSAYRRFLGLVSHEFFHTWNVKQLRPAGINPYDYTRENYTKLLWVAEGTTSYYDDLTLVRTGHLEPKPYLKRLGEAIDALRKRPGARVQSLESSSFDAWIKFNKRSPHSGNSTVSFYSKGALVSLLLDCVIRERTDSAVTLDLVMRKMFEDYPLSGPGFTTEDLVTVVETLTGSKFTRFFEDFVAGTAPLPFEESLRVLGLEVAFDPAADDEESFVPGPDAGLPMKADLGVSISASGDVRSVRAGSAAFAGGLVVGDELVALDGERLTSDSLGGLLKQRSVGDVVTISYFRRDHLRTVELALTGVLDGAWIVRKAAEPTEAQRAAFESWCGQPFD